MAQHGLRAIADRIHHLACLLKSGLDALDYQLGTAPFFDTIRINSFVVRPPPFSTAPKQAGFNLRQLDSQTICVALDERSEQAEIAQLLLKIFDVDETGLNLDIARLTAMSPWLPEELATSTTLQEPVFNRITAKPRCCATSNNWKSATYRLCHAMIPLGSCTMKLNAAIEMAGVSWPEFGQIHPFAPTHQTKGYITLFQQLEQWLATITGFSAVSLQPNAGSQGEFAGLLAIRAWHKSRGEEERDVCLIPTSAHGTNPASAT